MLIVEDHAQSLLAVLELVSDVIVVVGVWSPSLSSSFRSGAICFSRMMELGQGIRFETDYILDLEVINIKWRQNAQTVQIICNVRC